MYYVLYGFVYLLSRIPFWLFYGVADVFFVVVYYILGYRKKIVMNNLAIAFPEKSLAERKGIARKFYRNLIDNFMEAIKLLSISPEQLSKRFRCDYSLLERLYAEGKSCQLHLGHNFNWEYANAHISMKTGFKFLVVYMPIGSAAVDRLFHKFRGRFGTILLPATDMRNAMLPFRNEKYILTLVADQNPGDPQRSYWCNFFSQPAPFVKGPEKGARFNDLPVVFVSIKKEKRGYYTAGLVLAEEHPASLPEGELTRRFVHFLEQEIAVQPESWLWSHRRWKFPYQPEYDRYRVDK